MAELSKQSLIYADMEQTSASQQVTTLLRIAHFFVPFCLEINTVIMTAHCDHASAANQGEDNSILQIQQGIAVGIVIITYVYCTLGIPGQKTSPAALPHAFRDVCSAKGV